MVLAAVMLAALMSVSCENEKYALTEENLDPEVQVFSEGLTLPLGSLDKLMLKDLLSQVEGMDENEFLGVIDGGTYALNMSDSYDFSESLNGLLEGLEIAPIQYAEDIEFSLESVDVSSVKIDETTFPADGPYEVNLSEMIGKPELPTIDPLEENASVAMGVADCAPKDEDLALPVESLEKSSSIISVSDAYEAPGGLLNDTPIPLDGLQEFLTINDEFTAEHSVDLELSLPEGVGRFNSDDITLDPNAQITISVELVDPFLHSGSITPDIDMNIGNLLKLRNIPDGIINMGSDFALNESNGYSASKSYPIDGIVINENGWSAAAPYKYTSSADVVIGGSIQIADLKTTTNLLNSHRETGMKVVVSFENFSIADVKLTIDPITVEPELDPITVEIPETEIPEQIEKIEYVSFSENSAIDIEIKPSDLSSLPDLDLTIDEFVIDFPQGMVVEGTNADNQIVVSKADVKNGYTNTIKVKRFDLPALVDNKLSYKEEITVKAVALAEGSINTSMIPKEDITFDITVKGNLEIADYCATIAKVEHTLETIEENISFDLPDDVKDMEHIIVYPECTDPSEEPAITMDFRFPENTTLEFAPIDVANTDGVKGLKVTLPSMVEFKQLPAEYNYDAATHSINFLDNIPEKVVLPIEKLVIVPETDEAGKLVATSRFKVEGGLMIKSCELTKADIDALTDPANVISVQARIPAMEPSTIGIDTYSTSISQEISMDFDLGDQLPEELKAIGLVELKDVYLDFNLDATKLPDLNDINLDMNLTVTLPEMIVINDARVDKQTGELKIKETLDPATKTITIAPVKIDALNLEGYDLSEGISGLINLEGVLEISDATLDVDEWVGKNHELGIRTSIKSESENGEEMILIDKVQAKVDYQIDPVAQSIDLSALAEISNQENLTMNMDLSRFHIAFELSTNLSVPLSLDLGIVPFYGEEAGEPLSADINIKAAESVENVSVLKFWISNTDSGMPAGYEFIELDLLSLLEGTLPDKLDLNIAGGTDAESYTSIGLSDELLLKADYMFALPLEPGENFEVVYRDTIPDLPEVVSQIMSYGSVSLRGKFENSLPLALDLSFNLLDAEGKAIELVEGAGKQVLPSRNLDGTASTCDLNLTLGKKKGVDASTVSSLEIIVTANSGNASGQALRETDYVTGNILIAIPDGISLNLKDLGVFDSDKE